MKDRDLSKLETEVYTEYSKVCPNGAYRYIAQQTVKLFSIDSIVLVKPEIALKELENAELLGPINPVTMREYYIRGIEMFQSWLAPVLRDGKHEHWYED